jgi:hypothetical protein
VICKSNSEDFLVFTPSLLSLNLIMSVPTHHSHLYLMEGFSTIHSTSAIPMFVEVLIYRPANPV